MHPPVPEGVDGPALHPPRGVAPAVAARFLSEGKAVAVAPGLLDDEERQTPMGLRPVGVGPGQQHDHVGPGGEGAPGLGPVDEPPTVGRSGRGDDVGHVGAEVRFGHGHRVHDLPEASAGSHRCFCSSVPPATSARDRISGRVISEPPAPSDPHDSSSVATTIPM